MTPEVQKIIDEMKSRIDVLENAYKAQEQADQVTPSFARMLGEVISSDSGKTVASGSQAVNESGASSYNVMKAPDGFIKIGDRNVPYIN